LIATIIGGAASIGIVGVLTQTRDLILAVFSAWLGLSVYAAGLFDGYRAYAADLSGYTVALIAVQQIDSPQQVFEAGMARGAAIAVGMARGAAIAVGIAAVTIVNDLFLAPDRHSQLAAQLEAIHQRTRDYAKALLRDEVIDPVGAAALIREIVGLRADTTSLAAESSSGSVRGAAARKWRWWRFAIFTHVENSIRSLTQATLEAIRNDSNERPS
jgi:uncharacterized membrane protein YccC